MKPSKTPLLVVVLLWALMQALLLVKNGIVTDGEAEKYISEANLFLTTGKFTSSSFWLYSTQIFLLITGMLTKLGFVFVVIVQLLFNLVATLSFYSFTGKLFSKSAALTGTIIFILSYPLQEFNTFLQTESLYYSLTIIFSCKLLQLTRVTLWSFLAITGALILISVTRPTGILFVPCAFLYLFFHFFKTISTGKKILIVSGVTVAFLYFLNLALGSGGELDFMLPYLNEHIICGVPTLQQPAAIQTATDGNSLYGLFYYIIHNPGQFLSLAWRRTLAFFGLLRSYYSTGHNVYLAVYFYPVYILFIAGIRYWTKKNPSPFLYLLCCVLINWVTILLTCDDWHNRFFFTIWPYLIVLALPVINNLFAKYASNNNKASI